MNTLSIQRLLRKLEPIIVVLLLLYSLNPQLPSVAKVVMKYGSYGLVGLLVLGVSIGRWRRFAYVITQDIFPWLLLGLSIASVVWSASPKHTSDEIDPLIRGSMFAAYLAMRYTPKELMRLTAWTFGMAAVLSLLYTLALPSSGILDGLWRGIFVHKQYLGRAMAIGGLTLFNVALDDRRYRWLALAGLVLSIVLMLLSQSKSALLILLMSLSLFPLFNFIKQHYKLRVILLSILFLFLGCVAILVTTNLETILVEILGKNLEFNGRIPVWILSIQKGLERPWLGYGFSGFWTSSESYEVLIGTWAKGSLISGNRFHAHNGFIDVFLQLGLVGILLCALSFITLMLRTLTLMNVTNNREYFWIFQFLIIFLLSNVSIANLFVGSNTFWILYVSISFSTAIWCHRIKRIDYQVPNSFAHFINTAHKT